MLILEISSFMSSVRVDSCRSFALPHLTNIICENGLKNTVALIDQDRFHVSYCMGLIFTSMSKQFHSEADERY